MTQLKCGREMGRKGLESEEIRGKIRNEVWENQAPQNNDL